MMIKYIFIFLIDIYRYCISPFTPRSCRFYPTCSCYARESIMTLGNGRGSYLAVKFAEAENTNITYICDVDQRAIDNSIQAIYKQNGYKPKGEKDIRKLVTAFFLLHRRFPHRLHRLKQLPRRTRLNRRVNKERRALILLLQTFFPVVMRRNLSLTFRPIITILKYHLLVRRFILLF